MKSAIKIYEIYIYIYIYILLTFLSCPCTSNPGIISGTVVVVAALLPGRAASAGADDTIGAGADVSIGAGNDVDVPLVDAGGAHADVGVVTGTDAGIDAGADARVDVRVGTDADDATGVGVDMIGDVIVEVFLFVTLAVVDPSLELLARVLKL